MIELTIGSRFYHNDKLVEVTEYGTCKVCVMFLSEDCGKFNCLESERHDDTRVCFREVKND